MEKSIVAPLGLLLTLALTFPAPALSHGGGLDASGCHNDRQRGGYHCHNGGDIPSPLRRASRALRSVQPSFLVAEPRPVQDTFDGRLEAIQKMLSHLGYDPGPVDGKQGLMTRDAIKAFQKDQGFSETGVASATLVDQLIVAIGK